MRYFRTPAAASAIAFALICGQAFGLAPDPDDERANPFEDPRDRVFYPGDTERIKPLARKLFANVLLDQKEIWTSPFHMRTKDAKWWIGFGAVTGALIATDKQTADAFRNSRGQITW